MIEKLRSSALDFQNEIQKFKSSMIMNQIISFEPNDCIESFGNLDIEIDESRSEASFQLVIDDFSKFKESHKARVSQNCYVRNVPWKIQANSIRCENGSFNFGIYLRCQKDRSSPVDWSISTNFEFSILHMSDRDKNFVRGNIFPK